MIGFIKGKIHSLAEDYCLVDVQGIGYRVFLSSKNLRELENKQEVFLHTYTYVREDALLLYGFLQKAEYELFIKLINVSGIGAKGALGILASLSVEAFKLAIQTKNLTVLTKVPGIGKKTAERLVLELQDKFKDAVIINDLASLEAYEVQHNNLVLQDAILALQSLGYDSSSATSICQRVYKNSMQVEELLKVALKELARG